MAAQPSIRSQPGPGARTAGRAFACLAAVLCLFFSGETASADFYLEIFNEMDADQDRFATWEEYRFYFPDATKEAFDQADKNRDEKIGRREWTLFNAERDPYYEPEEEFASRAWRREGCGPVYCAPWPYRRCGYWPYYCRPYGDRFGFGLGFSFGR